MCLVSFFFIITFFQEDLWCNYVGDINDRTASRLQTYTHLIVVIIVYDITLSGEYSEVLCLIGVNLIQTFMI